MRIGVPGRVRCSETVGVDFHKHNVLKELTVMRNPRSLAIVLIVAALAGIAAAGANADVVSASKVNVKLVEFKLIPSSRSVAAGKVTFVVRNAGQLSHEFVVLKTATPASKLPVKGMTAVETGRVGALAKFAPGQTRTVTLSLKAGHYVLLCNLPGHYKVGQFADLTVR